MRVESKQKSLCEEIEVLKKQLKAMSMMEDKVNELCVLTSKSDTSFADEEEVKKKA